MEQLANKLTQWIKEQVLKAKKTGTVVGLSGGIDSAVVAVLCKRAFHDTTLAAILPCHSNKMDVAHAYKVSMKFKISTELVELEPVLRCSSVIGGGQNDVAITGSGLEVG